MGGDGARIDVSTCRLSLVSFSMLLRLTLIIPASRLSCTGPLSDG